MEVSSVRPEFASFLGVGGRRPDLVARPFRPRAGHRHGEAGRQTLVRAATALNELLEQGHLRVAALAEIDLSQVGEALRALRRQHTRGKIVLVGRG